MEACERQIASDLSLFHQRRNFWKVLFEEHSIAMEIPSLSCNESDKSFYVTHFGDVLLKVKAASSLGDNFFSDTYLIKAVFPDSNSSLEVFAKVMPGNCLMREAVYESRAHHREHNVYKILFEFLRVIRGDLPIPLDVPHFYHGHIEEIIEGESDGSGTCILLENLKEDCYQMVDKNEGLDEDHVRLALTSLAHYHALTMAALRKLINSAEESKEGNDRTFDCFEQELRHKQLGFLLEKTIADQGPVETIQPWLEVFIDLAYEINREDLGTWLSGLRERLTDIMQLDTIENSGPLLCIVHGDYWSNNILFKYEPNGERCAGEKPMNVKMVDFQIARISHPMSDLLYLLYISTSPQVRKERLENWLELYFRVLTCDLNLLNINLGNYCWSDFLTDYKKRSLRWMLYGGMIMALVHNNVVVSVLNDIHQKGIDTESAEAAAENLGSANSSTKLATTLSTAIRKNKLSKNPVLTERLIRLFEEVRYLNVA